MEYKNNSGTRNCGRNSTRNKAEKNKNSNTARDQSERRGGFDRLNFTLYYVGDDKLSS